MQIVDTGGIDMKDMKFEIINLIKSAISCVLFCAFIIVVVSLLLRSPFLGRQKAFLFRLLLITAICCVILLLISIVIFLKKPIVCGLSFSTCVLCIGISTLVMALFFSLGPMPIERSYTIYSLADMADHSNTIYSAEDIKTQFIEGYIEEANESQKRIDEQVYIGNLEEVPNGYRITEKGKHLIKLFRVIETVFPVPDKNSIYPNGK